MNVLLSSNKLLEIAIISIFPGDEIKVYKYNKYCEFYYNMLKKLIEIDTLIIREIEHYLKSYHHICASRLVLVHFMCVYRYG